jgi:hypothetical protein
MVNIKREFLKIIIPYIGTFLIFLGMLKLTIYYNAFNIKINHFLEITEVLTAFFNDLIFVSVTFAVVILINFLMITDSELQTDNKFHNDYVNEKSLKKRIVAWLKKLSLLLICDILFLVMWIVSKILHKNILSSTSLWVGINVQFVLMFLLIEYKRKHFIVYNRPLGASLYNTILFSIVVVIAILTSTYNEISYVKEKKKYINTSFKVKEQEIISDSTHYYIGQTKNYLFFYDETKNRTSVFPMSNVSQLNFGKDYGGK